MTERRAATARRLWQVLEPVHAIVYFAEEVTTRYRTAGLKGFWMGYFAGRSLPLGRIAPEVVAATFFNFHLDMVRRALPHAWELASPDDVECSRFEGVDSALRRLLGDAGEIRPAADIAVAAARACSVDGRPLFAAHCALEWPTEPHMRLWHAATLLREHRGDGHVAANVAGGFDGLAAHIMFVGTGRVARETLQPNRGWSDAEWDATTTTLRDRGLVDHAGLLTAAGVSSRQWIEDVTDAAAAEPWLHIGEKAADELYDLLLPLATRIVAAGGIPVPNPMGVPWPPDGS